MTSQEYQAALSSGTIKQFSPGDPRMPSGGTFINQGGQWVPFDPSTVQEDAPQAAPQVDTAVQPQGAPAAPAQAATAPTVPLGGLTDNGLMGGPTLTAHQSPAPPQIANQYDGQFLSDYYNQMNGVNQQLRGQYAYQTPQATAAQVNTSQVPQPQAQQLGQSADLAQLLSGSGLPADILARLNAQAIDNNSRAYASASGTARAALGNAGLDGSPAGAAILGDVSRQGAAGEVDALNNVAIDNAKLGNSNRLAGVGFQTQIGLTNLEQANQMALANANRLFSAMSQNTANQQQTNLSNTGAQQQQQLAGAGASADFLSGAGTNFLNSQVNRRNNADFTNNSNTLNWNEANTDRLNANDIFNANTQNHRWDQAVTQLGGYSALT